MLENRDRRPGEIEPQSWAGYWKGFAAPFFRRVIVFSIFLEICFIAYLLGAVLPVTKPAANTEKQAPPFVVQQVKKLIEWGESEVSKRYNRLFIGSEPAVLQASMPRLVHVSDQAAEIVDSESRPLVTEKGQNLMTEGPKSPPPSILIPSLTSIENGQEPPMDWV